MAREWGLRERLGQDVSQLGFRRRGLYGHVLALHVLPEMMRNSAESLTCHGSAPASSRMNTGVLWSSPLTTSLSQTRTKLFEFNPRGKTTGYNLRSFLHYVHLEENSDNKNGPQILSYQNEATVADYVKGVVVMCMQSLGYFDKGRLYKEMRLFSLRADLMLVIHKKTRGIILIIEVKMPGEELFTSEGIGKQVADNLLLQYRLGNTVPFVLLSSYREACLCHLKPGCLQTEDAVEGCDGDNTYRKIVERAARQVRDRADLGEMMGANGADQKDKPKKHSPTRPASASEEHIPLSLPWKHARRKSGEEAIVRLLSPEVVYSRPFNLSSMVHGVTLAGACGLASVKDASTNPKEDCYWPNHNSKIDGLHPQVESGKLQWVQVSNMSIDYMKAPLSVLDGQDISSKYICCWIHTRPYRRSNNLTYDLL